MRFDWYQASIPENPVVVVETLRNTIGGGGTVEEGRGRHNYHQSFMIRDRAGDRVATVLCGGPNGNPNVTASGEATERFVGLVRESWPVHRVTRFDAAEDFCAPGSFESLETVCRGVAQELGVKGCAIVPDNVSEGRTYYLGSASSDVRVRLYDKTAEVRRALPVDRRAEIPENWSRLEVQVRPRKEWKAYAAQAAPEQAWGFAGWTTELAARACALDVERIMMQAGRETDEERRHRFMLQQYGNHLRQLYADLGSWECVGKTLGDDLARMAERSRSGKSG